jgi:F-type H+-transporting ATPase subunit delta
VADKEAAKIYAGVLLDIGVENKILPRIEEELGNVSGIFSSEKDLMLFLTAPVISKVKKKDLINRLFSDKYCPDIINFLKVLIDNDRQAIVPEIYRQFTRLTDQISNRQRIKIITSAALDKDTLKRIEKSISEKLKKTVITETEVDKSILGGIIIRIDDKLIDGSIAKDLNRIRKKLIERQIGSGMAYED